MSSTTLSFNRCAEFRIHWKSKMDELQQRVPTYNYEANFPTVAHTKVFGHGLQCKKKKSEN